MANNNVDLTLKDAVQDILGMLTGLELQHVPEMNRFRAVTRQLNRALRACALENEWSYYSSSADIGLAVAGLQEYTLRSTLRPRIINDDSVRLVDDNGLAQVYAYFLPRDALDKHWNRQGLWVAHTRSTIRFSRPLLAREQGLHIHIPVMREPRMFQLPENEGTAVDPEILNQTVDFDYPDYVVLRAAYLYASSDPVMQPRVQTLEAQYKDMGYALIERDTRNTDAAYQNEWLLPIESDISGTVSPRSHGHPHSDERVWS